MIDRAMFFVYLSCAYKQDVLLFLFHHFYVSSFLLKAYKMELFGTLQREKDGEKSDRKKRRIFLLFWDKKVRAAVVIYMKL